MEMKSFYGPSVRAAVAQAEAEWGSNAVIVTARATPPESRNLGEHEVVCARGESVEALAPPPERLAVVPAAAPKGDIDELRRDIENIRRSLSRLALPAPAWLPQSSALAEYLNQLVAADVETELAHDIAEQVYHRLAGSDTDVTAALRAEIESRLATRRAPSRIACFMGAPGSGKTSTLVKVAAIEAVQRRRSVQVLSLDTWRVAAADQLRSFCAILGVGFQVVESAGLLQQAVLASAGKDLVLIDTPGISPADGAIMDELKVALASTPGVERHLVLPAIMQLRDQRRVLARLAPLTPTHLAFTQLDEAMVHGAMYSLAVSTGLPISYVCNGQQIPEDIAEPDAAAVRRMILPRQATTARHRAA